MIYTNDPADERVVDDRGGGIRLFVDNLLSEGEDDSREDLLIAKANQAMASSSIRMWRASHPSP